MLVKFKNLSVFIFMIFWIAVDADFKTFNQKPMNLRKIVNVNSNKNNNNNHHHHHQVVVDRNGNNHQDSYRKRLGEIRVMPRDDLFLAGLYANQKKLKIWNEIEKRMQQMYGRGGGGGGGGGNVGTFDNSNGNTDFVRYPRQSRHNQPMIIRRRRPTYRNVRQLVIGGPSSYRNRMKFPPRQTGDTHEYDEAHTYTEEHIHVDEYGNPMPGMKNTKTKIRKGKPNMDKYVNLKLPDLKYEDENESSETDHTYSEDHTFVDEYGNTMHGVKFKEVPIPKKKSKPNDTKYIGKASNKHEEVVKTPFNTIKDKLLKELELKEEQKVEATMDTLIESNTKKQVELIAGKPYVFNNGWTPVVPPADANIKPASDLHTNVMNLHESPPSLDILQNVNTNSDEDNSPEPSEEHPNYPEEYLRKKKKSKYQHDILLAHKHKESNIQSLTTTTTLSTPTEKPTKVPKKFLQQKHDLTADETIPASSFMIAMSSHESEELKPTPKPYVRPPRHHQNLVAKILNRGQVKFGDTLSAEN